MTGEFRRTVPFNGFGSWNDGAARFDLYSGKKSEWLVLVNAYLDLGTWWCVTPFIGVGVGWRPVKVCSFTDIGFITGPGAPQWLCRRTASKTNFAWALHAGLAYEVTPKFKVELAYRYVNLGRR